MKAITAAILAIGTMLAACGKLQQTESQAIGQLLSERKTPDFSIQDSLKVQRFPSGLQIFPLRVGPGPKPIDGDQVVMHYRCTIQGGATIDDTWTRKQPFAFKLGITGLIPGMDEAVRKLRMGSRAVLVIPPALGYTEENSPPNIPANSTLIYHVEMLGNISPI